MCQSNVNVFLTVSRNQEGRNVDDLSSRSNVALADQTRERLKPECLRSASVSVIFAVVCPNTQSFPSSQEAQLAHVLQHCAAPRDHVVVLISSHGFESRFSVIAVVWLWV